MLFKKLKVMASLEGIGEGGGAGPEKNCCYTETLLNTTVYRWLLNYTDPFCVQVKVNVGENKNMLDVEVHPTESIANVVGCLGNCIEFVVTIPDTPKAEAPQSVQHSVVNPFNLMMAAQRNRKNLPGKQYPVLKPNRKIDLKNDILKWLERNELIVGQKTPWSCRDGFLWKNSQMFSGELMAITALWMNVVVACRLHSNHSRTTGSQKSRKRERENTVTWTTKL